MDEQSLKYITATCRGLRDLAGLSGATGDATAFIAEQLKRMGYKPKTMGANVICDVGRGGNRLAFFADMNATSLQANGGYEQAAILLNVARIVGAKSAVPLRFIFGSDSDITENGVVDGVSEAYALRLSSEIECGKIGYCYGVMCAGCCEFSIIFCCKSEQSAGVIASAEYVAERAKALADGRSVTVTLTKTAGGTRQDYTVVFYDIAACEGFMIDLERAALKADDSNGSSHTVIANKVHTPLVNNALAVDKVRSLMDNKCVVVPPRNTSDSFSECLEKTTGCMALLGACEIGDNSHAFLMGTELFIKLIESYNV